MAVRQTSIEHNTGSPSPSNDHHVTNIASFNSIHTQSTDADSNLQPAIGLPVYTPEHDNSSRFSVNPSATISIRLHDPVCPVVNVNEQVSRSLTESPQSQQEQRHPDSTIDLEAQTPAASQRTMTVLSDSLDNIYTANSGLFRLLGSVLLCAGVAFALWQALQSRGQ